MHPVNPTLPTTPRFFTVAVPISRQNLGGATFDVLKGFIFSPPTPLAPFEYLSSSIEGCLVLCFCFHRSSCSLDLGAPRQPLSDLLEVTFISCPLSLYHFRPSFFFSRPFYCE